MVNIDKYVIYRRDRDKKSGGGVAIYVHDDLFSSEVADEILRNKFEKLIFEQVWCTVQVGKERICLAVFIGRKRV